MQSEPHVQMVAQLGHRLTQGGGKAQVALPTCCIVTLARHQVLCLKPIYLSAVVYCHIGMTSSADSIEKALFIFKLLPDRAGADTCVQLIERLEQH